MAFNLGDALKDVSKLGTAREQIEYIDLALIDEDANNFYKLTAIEELAANIQMCGLQQPIRLRINPENQERYVIVSGHRRRAALAMLAKDEPEKWQKVACIVTRDAMSPALQQLQLIYANANTRKLTDAEISEQAVQVEKLLYQLKEEGYEFPGRMRDHVAEAVGASKSKLARLKVIRENLVGDWAAKWKDGTLTENTAYELAKMAPGWQFVLLEEKTRTGANLKYLYADDVKKFTERVAAIEKLTCNLDGAECANIGPKMRKAAVSERWGWFHCDNKCCADCPELIRCKNSCYLLQDKVKQLKAEAKEKSRAEKAAQEEKERPAVEKLKELWFRFGLARQEAGKSVQAVCHAAQIFHSGADDKKYKNLEDGYADINANTTLPYGYSFRFADASRLIAMADLLGCSLDYLFCRTDVRETAKSAPSSDVPKLDTQWHPISEEPPAGIDLVWLDAHGYSDTGKYLGGQTIELASAIPWCEARWWAYLPEEVANG